MAAKAGVRRDADGIWFDGQVGGGAGGGGGGAPAGYADGTVIVDMRWDATGKFIQVKTATALLKVGTTSDWTDKIEFAQFDD